MFFFFLRNINVKKLYFLIKLKFLDNLLMKFLDEK